MKKILIISLLLIGIITFNNCKKITGKVWVYYDETYCANPWGESNLSESEKKNNIKHYLENMDVKVFKVIVSNENTPENCFSCGCKSGNIIKCKIEEKDVNVLVKVGFYQ